MERENLQIGNFSDDFLNDIIEIEKRSFKKPWTEEMFLNSFLNKKVSFKVAFDNGKIAGFCLYWTIEGETELLNIAVDPLYRRRSIAKSMLEYMEKDIKKENSGIVFLEVRESNVAAISLYTSLGYRKAGIRKKYYVDEDAIVLRKII